MKKLILFFSFLITVSFCFADTYFFRNGKGLAGISQADRKLQYWICFTTDYDEEDETWLHEDVLKAAFDIVDKAVRPKLGDLKLEILNFRKSGGSNNIAEIDCYWNDDDGYELVIFQLFEADGITKKDEINITMNEYNNLICNKVNNGERFDIVKLFKELKKKGK